MAVTTEIIKKKGDWLEVLNDCRSTVGKKYLSKEPSKEFKRSILIAEHSPIRDISIKWRWNLKSWIATHWSRHKWECFITTQRNDRTGIDRDKSPQDIPVTFTGEANVQNLIDTMRKRLCYMAHPETREYAEDLVRTIRETVDEDIGNVLVPNCIYRCGCSEIGGCGVWRKFLTWVGSQGDRYIELFDISGRYKLYHEYLEEMKNEHRA